MFPGFRIPGLEPYHGLAAAFGEFGVGVETRLGFPVEVLQIRKGVRVRAGLGHVGQQHAELRAPVTHVILAYDRVPERLEHPRYRIADDGAAQMADVHGLGQIGA